MADKWDQYLVKKELPVKGDKWDQYLVKPSAMGSIPERLVTGGWENVKGIYKTFRHPVDTATGLMLTLAGGLEHLMVQPDVKEAVSKRQEYQAVEKGIVEPVRKMVQEPSTIPGKTLNYAIDNPVNTLLMASQGAGLAGLPKVSNVLNPFYLPAKAIAKPIGKVVEAMKGRVPETPIQVLGKKERIPTTLGEDIGSSYLQKTETFAEKVPLIGTTGFRKKQLAAADAAAQRFLGEYIANPGESSMKAKREFTSKLYNDMKGLASQVKEEILPKDTRATAINLLETYPDIFKKFQNTKLEETVENIVKGTAVQTAKMVSPGRSTTSKIIPEPGISSRMGNIEVPRTQVIPGTPPIFRGPSSITERMAGREPYKTITFDEMWTLRDGLGEMIGQAKKKLASGDVDRTTISKLNALYKSVNQDIDSWTKTIGKPEISESIKVANDAYKTYVVKYRLIQDAYDKAVGTVGAGEFFSPKKFSTSLKNMIAKDKEYGTFTPLEIDRMTGLSNIMQVVKRAGQFRENPPTGSRAVDLMLGGGAGALAVAAPEAVAIGAATTGIVRFLTTTEPGKKLAMIAARTDPNSSAMNLIMRNIAKEMTTAGAAGEMLQPKD